MKYIRTLLCSITISCSISVSAFAMDTDTVPSGLYHIISAFDKNLVLEQKTCTVSDLSDHTLQIYTLLDTNQQKFYIEEMTSGSYRISTLAFGEALTAEHSDEFIDPEITIDLQDGASDLSKEQLEDELYAAAVLLEPIVFEDEYDKETAESETENKTVSAASQLWTFESTPAGFVYIRSSDGKYLTLDSDHAYNGTSVVLKNFTGDRTQKWYLSRTWGSAAEPADTDLNNPYAEDGAFADLELTLTFGDQTETLTAADIAAWMTETEEHQFSLDQTALSSYVETLAETYNTHGKARQFTTSSGETITLFKGDFGWKLDVSKTTDLILKTVKTGESVTLEPEWKHRGVIFEAGNDIGDSYVEVDLTNQKVWLYVDGKQILETDCVTGTYGTDRQTPGGVYSVYYRQSPDVLDGPGYSSPVEYWMAFNGGIGLHDANWRSSFGGDIYKTNGSHGCINLPTDAAAKIYEIAQIGFPVVCYN